VGFSLTGQFGFGYDALSRRTQLTRPNGVNMRIPVDVDRYSWVIPITIPA
jgi:hypothetical protein